MFTETERGYIPLEGGKSSEIDEISVEKAQHEQPESLCYRIGKAVAIVSTSLAVLLVYTWLVYLAVTADEEQRCTQHLAPWTPAFEAISHKTLTFEGNFFRPSKYRGTPSKEIDQAWDDLWKIGAVPVRVPDDKMAALNKSLDKPWTRIPDEKGGGIAGYSEVFHQLHCLNILRKATYREYYTDDEVFKGDPALVRAHQDHCIEMLRMELMCVADMTPMFTLDIPGRDVPISDFDSIHVCRDFDKLVEWQKSHAIHGVGNWHGHEI